MPNATPVELELRADFAKLKDEVEEAQRTIIEAAGQDQTPHSVQLLTPAAAPYERRDGCRPWKGREVCALSEIFS